MLKAGGRTLQTEFECRQHSNQRRQHAKTLQHHGTLEDGEAVSPQPPSPSTPLLPGPAGAKIAVESDMTRPFPIQHRPPSNAASLGPLGRSSAWIRTGRHR